LPIASLSQQRLPRAQAVVKFVNNEWTYDRFFFKTRSLLENFHRISFAPALGDDGVGGSIDKSCLIALSSCVQSVASAESQFWENQEAFCPLYITIFYLNTYIILVNFSITSYLDRTRQLTQKLKLLFIKIRN
jgi:hypothetical protein